MMERLLASWVLILVVILLRRLLRGRITPGLQYALWLLVAARLLIPGSLFPAPVSVAGAAADLREVLLDRAEDPGSPAVLRPLPDLYGVSAGSAGALPPPDGDGPSSGQRTQDVPEAAAKETPPGGGSSGIAPARLAARIWLAGAVLMAAALGMSNLLFALRLYRLRRPLNLPAGAGQGRLRVYVVEELASPCLFGLLRPAVYLNGAALRAACPGHVLAHEYTHYRHGDHIWALVRALCLAAYWFDPMVWLAASLSRRDCELACDAGTIRRLGEAQRLDYGRTLLALVPPGRSPADLLHTATTMTAGGRAMARRIALIARRPRMLKITLAAVVLVMCAAVAVTFGGRALAEPPAPEAPAGGAMPGGEQLNRRQGVYTFLLAGLDPSGRPDSIAVALCDVPARELNLLSLPRDVYIDVDWESKRLSAACAQPGGIQELRVQVGRLLGFLPDYCLTVDLNAAAALVDAIGGVMYDVPPQGMDYEDPFQNLSIHLEPGLQTLSGAQALGMLRYRYYKNGDLDRIALQQQFLKAALSRCLEDPPLLESLAVLAAGGVETDLTAEELLWFARQTASLSPDSLRAYTLPVLSMDLVENQSYYFADPEGTAALLDRFFNPYTQPVAAQDLHIVYMRSGRLHASDEEGALREALARLEALSGGDGIGYYARGVFGAPAIAQLSMDRLPALREAFASCAWTPADAPEAEPKSWHSTTVGPFTFYDSTPLVRWADGEAEAWYTVPGGWLAAEAALADWPAEELTAEEKRFLLLYREARSAWEMMTGGYMPLRWDDTLETGGGTMCAVGFFTGVDDLRGYLQTLFTPEVAEYLLSCRELREQNGQLYALPADRPSNVYAGEETVRAFPVSEEEALYYDEEAVVVTWTQVLGEDLETVLGQKRRDYACIWNGSNYIFTSFSAWDDVNPQVYVNALALWDSLQAGEEWLPLLAYMDWGALAGVDAGEYDAALEVLDELGHYINENGPELTEAEYLYILSAAEGLDGAYSEGYGYMVYQLYTLNPGRFAYVVLEQLPEEQRGRVLDCFRAQWGFHRAPYTVPSREEAIARLEADLAAGVSAGPSAMTLEQAGASFQFLPVNAYGVYAASYESSNPAAASVDESGTVTALSPGQAVITLHYEGDGGPQDFTCSVTCTWN